MTREHLPFIALNRATAPTPAASQFNAALKAGGHHHKNAGQGSEQVDLNQNLREFVSGDAVRPNKSYNANIGGSAKTKKAFNEWTARMLGMRGHQDTTFVTQELERGLIKDFAHMWAAPYNSKKFRSEYKPCHNPVVLVPKNSWALTNDIFIEAGFEIYEYEIDSENIAQSFEQALEKARWKNIVVAADFNFPHNATGAHLTREENTKIKKIADRHNMYNKDHAMALIYDTPYFSACKKAPDGSASYLQTGMDDVFLLEDFDPNSASEVITPVIAFYSGSKFFRTAQQGLSWIQATKDIAKKMTKSLNLSGNGPRYSPTLLENLTRGLHWENDTKWQAQLDADRQKFETNYKILTREFGDAVLKGGVNMVELFKLENLFNKIVPCHDGQTRVIPALGKTVEERRAARQAVIELIGNGTPADEGVVLVDGDEGPENVPLGRIALASDSLEFREIVPQLSRIIRYIQLSPDAPAP